VLTNRYVRFVKNRIDKVPNRFALALTNRYVRFIKNRSNAGGNRFMSALTNRYVRLVKNRSNAGANRFVPALINGYVRLVKDKSNTASNGFVAMLLKGPVIVLTNGPAIVGKELLTNELGAMLTVLLKNVLLKLYPSNSKFIILSYTYRAIRDNCIRVGVELDILGNSAKGGHKDVLLKGAFFS
jgi:hypothetical protein